MDEVIHAKLTYIIFENPVNHYMVGQFSDTDTYHIFTATGTMFEPKEDQVYTLTGNYTVHPRYGKQFQFIKAEHELPSSNEAIVRFLCSDTFPTIGKKTAESIVETLGEDCLMQIKEHPKNLHKVPKLTQKRIDILVEGIQSYDGFSKTYSELIAYGLEPAKISLLEQNYEDVLTTLKENCFRPYYEVYGFGYKSACKIADGMQVDAKDTKRQDAFIYETLRNLSMRSGNTYILASTLLAQFPQVNPQQIMESLDHLVDMDVITQKEQKYYPFHLYEEEKAIADLLKAHQFKVDPVDQETLDQYIKEIEFANVIAYDPIQKEAINTFFKKSCMILNGGPGTGKTTIVKGILQMCKSIYPEAIIQCCAPTGRASKRLAQLSGCNSKTIHSLLKWNMEDNTFGYNEDNPLTADFLIVDEFSMVDTHLFANLLLALPSRCRILLIGDENQLESVGPGKVFQDIIAANVCPIVHLEKIYRQSHGSGIVELASQIRHNQTCQYQDGVQFIENYTNEILPTVLRIAQNYDADTLQVLAPKYSGAAGIDQINQAMQAIYNPKSVDKKEITIGATTFREKDKIMLLKNLADEEVYNGDMGTIVSIEKNKQDYCVSVDFGHCMVDFTMDLLYYLKHAYCISIHKSQGSEYPVVCCIVDQSATHMYNQRILYTAISRAKKELFIIGQKRLFENSIQIKQKHIRQTSLLDMLKK